MKSGALCSEMGGTVWAETGGADSAGISGLFFKFPIKKSSFFVIRGGADWAGMGHYATAFTSRILPFQLSGKATDMCKVHLTLALIKQIFHKTFVSSLIFISLDISLFLEIPSVGMGISNFSKYSSVS